jgi:multiple sugar transport system permease protein
MTRWRDGLTISTKQAIWAWGFLALPVLFFVVVRFAPSLYAFTLAFTNWNILGTPRFVGFENFVRLWNDPVFWLAFANTFRYLILGVPISLVVSFVIAYYLDQVRFMHGFIRALYFVPFLTTAAAMAWVWKWLYQPPPIGFFNKLLALAGIAQQPFLNSTEQALPAVLAVAIWAGLGFNVVIFLAGLRAIPETYYEAARIDGVSRTRILWEITLPLLRPTVIFLVVISSIGFLRIFDQVFNMTTDGEGGPLNSTTPLVLMIYRTAFKTFQMGYATALTVVLFLVMLAVTLLQLWLTRKR